MPLATCSVSVSTSSSRVFTTLTSVEKPKDSDPRKPLLNACFILPESSAAECRQTEGADKRPFAFLGSKRKDIQVRRVETYRAGQFHDVSRSEGQIDRAADGSNSVGSSPTGFPSILDQRRAVLVKADPVRERPVRQRHFAAT